MASPAGNLKLFRYLYHSLSLSSGIVTHHKTNMVRAVKPQDIEAIRTIYNYYVMNTIITFKETPVTTEEMDKRIKSVNSGFPWLVYERDGEVLGYTHASNWKSRCAYKLSVESTVYLKAGELKKGLGFQLYSTLIKQLSTLGFHAVIAGISLPNEASIALFESDSQGLQVIYNQLLSHRLHVFFHQGQSQK